MPETVKAERKRYSPEFKQQALLPATKDSVENPSFFGNFVPHGPATTRTRSKHYKLSSSRGAPAETSLMAIIDQLACL